MLLPSTGFTCGTFRSNDAMFTNGTMMTVPGNLRGIEFRAQLFERNDGRILGAMRAGHQGERRPRLRAANYRNRDDSVLTSLPAETSMDLVTVSLGDCRRGSHSERYMLFAATHRTQLKRINASPLRIFASSRPRLRVGSITPPVESYTGPAARQ